MRRLGVACGILFFTHAAGAQPTSADIWALGVILYECLAGKRPTQAAGVGQIIKLITTDSIVPLRSQPGEKPSWIRDY